MRAMFDRIAGFYDVMNSVMTAGLHHRWRARAADLAAVGPGDRVLDVATGTGDLAVELAAPRRRRPARSSARTSPRRCSSGPARRRPAIPFEWGNALDLPYADDALRRGHGRLRRPQLLRPRPGPARDGARGRSRAAGSSILEITTPTKPPLSTFFRAVVRPRRAAARPRRRRRRRLRVPAQLGEALPGPRRASRRRWTRAGLERHPLGPDRRRASSRSTSARSP